MKDEFDPMGIARCGARTRAGHPCGRFAMKNGRCRLHGGLSTGPKTREGFERTRQSRIKSGLHTKEMREMRRQVRELLRASKNTISEVLKN